MAFPFPTIVLSGPGEPADKHKVIQVGLGSGLPSSGQWLCHYRLAEVRGEARLACELRRAHFQEGTL